MQWGEGIMSTDKEPLLKAIGYQKLIEMLSLEEMREAQTLLASFLKDMRALGPERVAVLAYLMGIQQGYHELYGDNAAQSLAERLVEINRMGRVYGFLTAILLFDKGCQFVSAIFPRQKNTPPAKSGTKL